MNNSSEALYRDLYTAVGQMTLRWAAVEMAVDVLAAVIFKTIPKPNKNFPAKFSAKTEFLDERFNNMGNLKDLKPEADQLIKRLDEGADQRNWLIHGLASSLPDFEKTGVLRIIKTKYMKKEPVKIETINISLNKIFHTCHEFQILAKDVNNFSREVESYLSQSNR